MRPKTHRLWTIPKKTLQDAVDQSGTYREVLTKLNVEDNGGSRTLLKKILDEHGISRERFGSGWSRNDYGAHKTPTPYAEILVEGSTYRRTHLKKRLIKDGLLEEVCAVCRILPEWEGKPLVLVLDHINGVPDDNRLENLRLICPNCNSQTDTFAGRNVNTPSRPKKQCLDCGGELKDRQSLRCVPCYRKSQRKHKCPSRETLKRLLWEKPTSAIAKEFGVSDCAVGKWAKSLGLSKPPRGYWQKINAMSSNGKTRRSERRNVGS